MAAEFREDVDGDDVAEGGFVRGHAEAGDFGGGFGFGDDAIAAWEAEVISEFALGIGDGGIVAGLVDYVEGFEIFGGVGAQSDFHSEI